MPSTWAPAWAISGGQMTGAASGIQDAFARLGSQQRQKVAAEFPDEGVGGIVESGIPVRLLHLSIVFTTENCRVSTTGALCSPSPLVSRLILHSLVADLQHITVQFLDGTPSEVKRYAC